MVYYTEYQGKGVSFHRRSANLGQKMDCIPFVYWVVHSSFVGKRLHCGRLSVFGDPGFSGSCHASRRRLEKENVMKYWCDGVNYILNRV